MYFKLNWEKRKFQSKWNVKGQMEHVEKIGQFFFSSTPFAICLNRLHPQPSLFLFGFLSPLWCFSTLENFRQFKGDFVLRKNDLKYRDIAPLLKLASFIRAHWNKFSRSQLDQL